MIQVRVICQSITYNIKYLEIFHYIIIELCVVLRQLKIITIDNIYIIIKKKKKTIPKQVVPKLFNGSVVHFDLIYYFQFENLLNNSAVNLFKFKKNRVLCN